MSRSSGPNFEVVEREDGIAVVRVWRRPDLSRDEGARCAELLGGHMDRLARLVHGCVFDLTAATTEWGPATNSALGAMLGAWERAAKPIHIIAADSPIQRLLLRELQRQQAPQQGHLIATREQAIALLSRAPTLVGRR